MTSTQVGDGALSPELEAIATAADDRLRADAGQDLAAASEAQRRVAEAAGAAIAAGAALSAIAEAERTGQLRARGALGADVLRQVTRAAKRKRDAARALPPRDRSRWRGLARDRPRDPLAWERERGRQ
jgi:hypothetical protein